MSIRDFYLSFVSGDERKMLFVALRKISRMEISQTALAASAEELGWPIWEETRPSASVTA